MEVACIAVVALLLFALFIVVIVGFVVRSQTKPAGPPGGQVRLGADGFFYDAEVSAGPSEVGYRADLMGGEHRVGTLVSNGPETWVYTGARPLRVTILGSRPAGASKPKGGGFQQGGGFKPSGGPQHHHHHHPHHHHHDPHHHGHHHHDQHHHQPGYPHDQQGWQGGYQPPGEWGGGSSGGSPDYPQTYSGDSSGPGYDYAGGGGQSGGGGSSVGWDSGSSGGWDSGSSGGNDSYPSAY